jgi:diguanylate cyclase (GGDEF)-like protein/PAS domain S-box-containing protein
MQILSSIQSRSFGQRFKGALRVTLAVLGIGAIVLTGGALYRDYDDTTAAAMRADHDLSGLVRMQTDAIFESPYYSVLGIAREVSAAPNLRQYMDQRALRSLQTAMTYDSVSHYLFIRSAGVMIAVDSAWRRSSDLDKVVEQIDAPGHGRQASLLAPVTVGSTGAQYVPLVISESRTANGDVATIGALIPLAKLREQEFLTSVRPQVGQALYLLDGTVLMRNANEGHYLGHLAPESDAVSHAGAQAGSGPLAIPFPEGGILSGYYFRSARFPFIAVSGRDSDYFLSPWRIRSAIKVAVLVLFLVLLWIGNRLIVRSVSELSTSETIYRRLFEDVADAVLVCNRSGEIEALNLAALEFFQQTSESDVIGRSIFEYIPRKRDARTHSFSETAQGRFERAMAGERLRFEVNFDSPVRRENMTVDMHLSSFALDGTLHLLVVIRDLTVERRYLKQQEYLANHDPLTGLPNRLNLVRTIDRRINDNPGTPLQLILIDLMRFREVNDTFGHRAGDMVLELTARRLSARLSQEGWTVARAGGDELVAVSGEGRHLDLRSSCALVSQAIGESIALDETRIEMRAKMGSASYPDDALDASQLLRCAAIAVAHAKTLMGAATAYSKDIDRAPGRDLKLRGDLSSALREGQLCLAYQPKLWLEDREVSGVEALLRWNHPKLGWVAPSEFIPVIEMTELIYPLTAWVLAEAVEQIRLWQAQGRNLTIAVNISANNLQDPDFSEYVKDLLSRKGVNPRLLELEVTEGALVRNPEIALRRLNDLRAAGINLSLDDFGMGFSSLAYVRQFPFSSIKIDRSFVTSMLDSPKDRQVAQSTIALGRNLGLITIAEGVESEPTASALMALECDIGQGHLFAEPMLIDEFEAWWKNYSDKLQAARAIGQFGRS